MSFIKEDLDDRFRVVRAKSAGIAIGMVRRGSGLDYSGIMLDHDLDTQSVTRQEKNITGMDVANAIIEHIDRQVPIFVHSNNTVYAPQIASLLRGAHFSVEQVLFDELRGTELREWLNYVIESSEQIQLYKKWKDEKRREEIARSKLRLV